ncbi:MAG: hypothetical protein SPJ89_10215 [Treponema sp.]|nr:hypothetical protein [Spirochaetia bacterium]MDD7459753.1 hypothetical protein [Spirochaetales bacterium]MDY5812341.1 hypothetical protein [Treponema sp.]
MIYWILHKKLTKKDFENSLEGKPSYFYGRFGNFCFVDISNFSLFGKIENRLLRISKTNFQEFGIDSNKYIFIDSKKDFYKKIILKSTNTKNDIFVFQSYNNIRIKQFYKLLTKENKQTLLLNHWQLPIAEKYHNKKNLSFLKKLFTFDKKILFLRFLYRFYHFDSKKFSFNFDYSFSSGNKMIEDLKKANVFIKKVIPVHSISFDEFLSSNVNNTELVKEPYFVFINQALTIHPDNRGLSQFTEQYKNEIISTLNFISKQNSNIKIAIAEHPRCHFEKGFWNSFNCYQGKTAELIKNAKAVIGHFSTALNLSLFYKKKLFLLTSTSKYFPFDKNVTNAFNLLGGTLIDMHSCKNLKEKENSEIELTDYFTLLPESKENNLALFSNFLSLYDKKKYKIPFDQK